MPVHTIAWRYWHTLRHLRPVQFYGRLWFKCYRPRPDLRPAPLSRHATGKWVRPARREASLIGPDVFWFLGQDGGLAEVGWDGQQRAKLWRYNQHYFDDLNARGAESRRHWHQDLMLDWVRANPPGQGNGWEPYPASLRIVNWVKWVLAGNELSPACHQSLAVQTRWLAKRLETHLLGNHLFANAKALVFAGLYFDGAEARRWLETGMELLRREVLEQVLGDGGHFERSTMYHALAVEDMLDLCNLTTCFSATLSAKHQSLAQHWRERMEDMLRWLHIMCHPDGEIAFFNDAAFGVAPTIGELDAYALRLGFPSAGSGKALTWLAESGYARLEQGEAVVLVDLAPVGPDYLPGHAHADTMSFEMSLFGHRVLVNSGTSCYGSSSERLRQRGTGAHNTVIVDGENSSEVWGGFRVARRARPMCVELREDTPQSINVSCSHDGYRRLPGRPMHSREWGLDRNSLVVRDLVSGPHGLAEARFHLHPAIRIESNTAGTHGTGWLPSGHAFSWQTEEGSARIEPSSWHPRFGASESSFCIVVRLAHGRSVIRFTWD